MSKKEMVLIEVTKETNSDTLCISMRSGDKDETEIGDIDFILRQVAAELNKRIGIYNVTCNNKLPNIGFDFAVKLDLNDLSNNHRFNNYTRDKGLKQND